MKKEFRFGYESFSSHAELTTDDRILLDAAREACAKSYAPYSGFRVGAAARLADGRIVTAANQESEVFPAGVCAERALLFSHMNDAPEDNIEALAIISTSTERECYPCGICRQTILDAQRRQGVPIRVIMGGRDSATTVDDAACLLPFCFSLPIS